MPIGPKNNRPINVTALGGDDRIFTPAQPPHCRRYSRSNCDFWADSNRRLVGAADETWSPSATPRGEFYLSHLSRGRNLSAWPLSTDYPSI